MSLFNQLTLAKPKCCLINGNCLMAAEQADKVKMLTNRISPILHGHNPEIHGAVLAELLATWLAGHCTHWKAPPFHGARHKRTHAPKNLILTRSPRL
jgi:hypothetical protein